MINIPMQFKEINSLYQFHSNQGFKIAVRREQRGRGPTPPGGRRETPTNTQCFPLKICGRQLSLRCQAVGPAIDEKEDTETYDIGQTFINKTFGYRGVIFGQNPATLHITEPPEQNLESLKTNGFFGGRKKEKKHKYYHVLCDERDIRRNDVSIQRVYAASDVTNKMSKFLVHVRGVDLVPHEDVLPYQSTENPIIENKLFAKWQTNTAAFIEEISTLSFMRITSVFQETTEKVRVTVMPFYLKKSDYIPGYFSFNSRRPEKAGLTTDTGGKHYWRYVIRVDNLRDDVIQIRNRKWTTLSIPNSQRCSPLSQGVVGMLLGCVLIEFVFSPDFSNLRLTLAGPSSIGAMATYGVEKEDGGMFTVKVPRVMLESRKDKDDFPNISPPVGMV
uniref:Polymerase delta-interacting protein 2 n=1 Tax=Magallana gigas TaxID=29159 RepID=K1R0J8_MAGGI